MSWKPDKRFAVLSSWLWLALACPAPEAASTPQVLDVRVYTAERVEVRTGPVEGVLNLDPQLVKLVRQEAQRIVVEGLSYGVATLRVRSGGSILILRVHVLGSRPAAPEVAGVPGPDSRAFTLLQSARYFGYLGGGDGSWSGIPAQQLDAQMRFGSFTVQARTWLEQRGNKTEVPHYDVLLQHKGSGFLRQTLLDVGTVEVDWSPYTFSRERLRGGWLELRGAGAGQKQPAFGLQLLYGTDAPDFVTQGSQFRLEGGADARLGGGRLWWRPSAGLRAQAELGYRSNAGQAAQSVAALGASGRTGGLDASVLGAYDGTRWAGSGSLRWARSGSSAALRAEQIEAGFRTLESSFRQPGSQRLSASLVQSVGKRLHLGAASSLSRTGGRIPSEQESGCPPLHEDPHCDPSRQEEAVVLENQSHELFASFELGPHVRLGGRGKLGKEELSEVRWQRRGAGLELALRGAKLAGKSRLGLKLGWDVVDDEAGGSFEGRHAWQSLRLEPELSLLDCWTLSGSVERRFLGPGSVEKPAELLWAAQLRGSLPGFGPLSGGHVDFGYREWESLGSSDGKFVSGQQLGASLGLGTRSFRGFTLEAQGGWTQDLALGHSSASMQIGLSYRLDAGALVPAASSVQSIPVAEARKRRADFGLGPAPAVLEVVVFNDLNENGVFEEGEPLVPGVVLRIPELGLEIRSEEHELGRQPLPIGRPVTGVWDQGSLPSGYRPTRRSPPAAAAEAGQTVRWQLPLVALRSIRGRVLLDANGNGRSDPGEAPAQGVVLQAGSRRATSDPSGAFTLKALPPGQVEIRAPGLLGGWRLLGQPRIELGDGPSTVQDVEILLQRGNPED